jgi:DnaJ-class molecular chaperone
MPSSSIRDPYEVLGVPRSASADDIKAAYRKLAKQYHPDLNPGKKTEAQFKDVSVAYDLLSDADKRKRFDRGEIDAGGNERPRGFGFGGMRGRGARGEHAQGSGGGGGFAGRGFGGRTSSTYDDFDPYELFADLFGSDPRSGKRGRGADDNYSLAVDFVTATAGGLKRIDLPSGRTLDVTIPPGTTDGQTLRLKGQGQPGAAGAGAGDAYIEIKVLPHPYFTREGQDIRVDVPVTLKEAVLGGKITVPTIDGPVTLTVPKGANTGTTLRLKAKGVASKGKPRGDQYVRLQVMLPDHPDAALEQFASGWSDGDYDVRAKAGMSR